MKLSKIKNWLQRNTNKTRAVCVLGMHRSGTSFLTGSLQQAGLELHRFHQSNPHNLKGNRENQAIVELNNWLLDSNGGSWDSPPAKVTWSAAQMAQGRELIDEYSHYPLWGFKDPRVLITLEFWLELVPYLEFVGVFRHPQAVAESLHARNAKTSIAAGLELWQHYNHILLRHFDRVEFPILQFDQKLGLLNSRVEKLGYELELPNPEAISFLDDKLVNQQVSEEIDLPSDIRATYERLCAIAFQ